MLKDRRKGDLVLLAAEALILALLFLACFRRESLVQSVTGSELLENAVQSEHKTETQGNSLRLRPGVYSIRVKTALMPGQSMFVELQSQGGCFGALRGNGVTIFSGDDQMEFYVYVLNTLPEAFLRCDFYGVGLEGLEELQLVWTNKGNCILFFLALVLFCGVDFLVEYRRRILAGVVSQQQQVVFWTLLFGVLLAYFPYLTDYFSLGADTLFHLTRVTELANTLKQGADFPIRIQSGWIYDHGYAVSLFYGDLFLFFPAVLMLLGFPLMTAYKLFVLAMIGATALIAYHSFYKCVRDRYAALFGSMLYLLMPYHIFNLYGRSAVGECLAMVFLPLVCCGMYLLYMENTESVGYKRHKWYLVLGMSAILQSHLISTEMTAFFMAVVCVIFWRKTFRRETFLQLLEATGITLLVNMWFWLPMLFMLQADVYHLQEITSEAVQDRGLLFAALWQMLPNKGSAQTGMMDCEPVQLGGGTIMLLVIYLLWQFRFKKGDKICSFFAVMSLVTLMMSTRYLPWDKLMKAPLIGPMVSSLQFPSRWMALANVFAAIFGAVFFRRAMENGGELVKAAVYIAAALSLGSAVYHVGSIAYESNPVFLYAAENMGTNGVGNGEYLLEEAPPFALDMYYHKPVAEEGLEWSDYEQRGTRISLRVENKVGEACFLELPLMGYQGYVVKSNVPWDAEQPQIAEQVGTHGDLRIRVPAGFCGDISVSYEGFGIFHIAEAASLASIAVLLFGWFWKKGKRGKR